MSEGDRSVAFRIQIYNIARAIYSYSVWQTLFGTLVVSYIIYKRIRKREEHNKDLQFLYNKECPVCFNYMNVPVKANCNHGYCLECIYTYWKKPSWNNLCPLCRYPIENLVLIENDQHHYLESTRKLLLKRVQKISPKPALKSLKLSTILYYLLSTIFCLVWTWNIINLSKIIQFTIWLYDTVYKEIEIEEV